MTPPLDAALAARLLVGFLREEAGKFGFRRAVLGLSGGVDSAVTAALAARAFGGPNVLA
ncbi:MAG TPA: NAD(+) synthetase, partial [Planctomycetota bacterium]|nr:NAD(+) synthetase [Planctomycetota bacterium]